MYAQTNYPNLLIGNTGLPVSKYGCLIVDWVNALNLAGYTVTVEDFVTNMNQAGGFTYDGNLIWDSVVACYPQVHLDQEGFIFQQGNWGTHEHWLLLYQNHTYDPWTGGEGTPSPFTATSNRTAGIDPFQAPDSTPAAPTPFVYTVVEGDTLSAIVSRHYLISDPTEIYNKYMQVAQENNIPDPNLITPGQTITLN